MRCRLTSIAVFLLALAGGRAQAAEFVAADLSSKVVKVGSNFTGTEIVLFGAFVETKRRSINAVPNSDVIVVVKGPPERVTVREKGHVWPIWMNVDSVTFTQAPSFYFMASTVPLDSILSTNFLDENEIGLKHLKLAPKGSDASPGKIDAFRQALLTLRGHYRPPFREQQPRYAELVDAKECRTDPTDRCFFKFSANALFNARLPIPANVPIGKLQISLYFLRDGQIVPNATQNWVLDVSRTGLEGWLYKHSEANPILYGLGAIFLAVMAGGTAAIIVRK